MTRGQSKRTGIENKWYALTGRVVAVKAETDGDIHIALQDATGDRKTAKRSSAVAFQVRWPLAEELDYCVRFCIASHVHDHGCRLHRFLREPAETSAQQFVQVHQVLS